jgi:hypothetical protein
LIPGLILMRLLVYPIDAAPDLQDPSLLIPILLAALAGGNAPAGSLPRSLESLALGATQVELHGGGDTAVTDQVRRVLPSAVRAAARWGALPASVTVTVHATHEGLEAAAGRSGTPWMRAWARDGAVDLQSPRTWSRGLATDEALTQILAHELTHCVLFHALGRDGGQKGIPTWFLEGMASVAAGERHTKAHADAVSHPVRLLRSDPRLVYGTADRAFRDLVTRFGDSNVRLLLSRLGEGHTFPAAFRGAMGVTLAEFEDDLERRLSAIAISG